MNIRHLDIENLSSQDARDLHRIFAKLEQEVAKHKKIKLFEPGITYQIGRFYFDVNRTVVRRTVKKTDNSPKTFVYSVYSDKDVIGEGSYGVVYKLSGKLKHHKSKMIYHRIDQYNAAKQKVIKRTLEDDDNDMKGVIDAAKSENQIARLFPDLNAKKITVVYKNEKPLTSFIEMNKIAGVDFSTTIYKFVYSILQMLLISVNALAYLFEIDKAEIIHRDLKPENMMIDHENNYAIKILDFGFSRSKNARDGIEAGTKLYMSPEMISQRDSADEKSDVYSMGLILRELWKDEHALEDIARLPLKEISKTRKKQYKDNEQYVIKLKDEIISRWQKILPDVDISQVENVLLHMTASKPGNRVTIAEARDVFKSILLQVPLFVAMKKNEVGVIEFLLNEGVQPDYEAFSKAVRSGYWEAVAAFIKANPQTINHPRCLKAYGHALLAAGRAGQTQLVNRLLDMGVKDREVYDFLMSEQFIRMESYLPDVREKDATKFRYKVEKYGVFRHFVDTLKSSRTMKELHEAYKSLEHKSKVNPYSISDYATLNVPRGYVYRMFQLRPTTIGLINESKQILPPLEHVPNLRQS